MGREVCFSFASDEEKQEYEALARSLGLSLSQYVRHCAHKDRLNRERGATASRAYRARRRGADAESTTDTVEAK